MSSSSGLVRRVTPLKTIDFTGVAGGSATDVNLGKIYEATSFSEADVLVRLHSGTVIGSGASLILRVHSEGYDFEDPAADFQVVLAVSTVSSWTAPALKVLTLTSGFSRYLRVSVRGVQPATPVLLVAAVSVDLVLKDGDPLGLLSPPNSARGYGVQ